MPRNMKNARKFLWDYFYETVISYSQTIIHRHPRPGSEATAERGPRRYVRGKAALFYAGFPHSLRR
jgi:hypothetical protein